ncbi:hypothetical protein COCOBI_15-0760 [Coccomyxa sp. Obi]|nr:hypothetical protein COCOBI_15-0760 [Coccomyxa sp. Obi]
MRTWLFGALLVLALLATCANAQFGGGFGGAPEAAPVKSDLPYIRCGACEALAKHAFRIVKAVRGTLKPGKKLEELVILELVERMGNPAKDEGNWIATIDLVEDGKKLKLVEHEQMGKCTEACKTIQRAVEEILSDHDTDMAEKLWQDKMSRAQFSNWLCYELTKACASKPPPLPKDRKPVPAFQVIDPQEAQMQKMMASMKEMGMGGQMYDRASVEKMVGEGGPGGDDDDDDDDDEDDDEASEDKGTPAAGEAASPVESTLEGAKEVLSKARDVAGAAVDQAKEGLSKAYSSAKNLVSGFASGKADEKGASEL